MSLSPNRKLLIKILLAVAGISLFVCFSVILKKFSNSYVSALILVLSIACIYAFFFLSSKRDNGYYAYEFKDEELWITILKWVNAAMLAGIGVYLYLNIVPERRDLSTYLRKRWNGIEIDSCMKWHQPALL